MTLEDLENLDVQMRACKVELEDASLVHGIIQECADVEKAFTALVETKAFFEEFKRLERRVNQIPVALPEVSLKLAEVMKAASALLVRVKLLKDYASSSKLEKDKVEQFLYDYRAAELRIKEAEELREELEYGRTLISDVNAAVSDSAVSLDTLNTLMGKLGSLKINMGEIEDQAKTQVWKKRVDLAQTTKVSFQILSAWYSEGLKKRDPTLTESL